jgi:hypothetical protein
MLTSFARFFQVFILEDKDLKGEALSGAST